MHPAPDMTAISIRPFRPADAPALRALFHAAVHGRAQAHYTPEQRAAWAPPQYDAAQWADRMQALQPFIAQVQGADALAGFADLQANGYIDMFFVAPAYARRGVARALMAHIHAQAALRGIAQLHAHVSLTAEPFFAAQGFVVQERQQVERAGVVLCNARMAKSLAVGGDS
jgi:putative acetyltransferase